MHAIGTAVFAFAIATSAMTDDRLPPCPKSPNCVSTAATDPKHAIAPMRFHGPRAAAVRRLEQMLRTMPRVTITHSGSDSIRAEFRTAVFRFVDDVAFVFDDNGTIHFRSASRTGYSDLGVNRRRMESIRAEWTRIGG